MEKLLLSLGFTKVADYARISENVFKAIKFSGEDDYESYYICIKDNSLFEIQEMRNEDVELFRVAKEDLLFLDECKRLFPIEQP